MPPDVKAMTVTYWTKPPVNELPSGPDQGDRPVAVTLTLQVAYHQPFEDALRRAGYAAIDRETAQQLFEPERVAMLEGLACEAQQAPDFLDRLSSAEGAPSPGLTRIW